MFSRLDILKTKNTRLSPCMKIHLSPTPARFLSGPNMAGIHIVSSAFKTFQGQLSISLFIIDPERKVFELIISLLGKEFGICVATIII